MDNNTQEQNNQNQQAENKPVETQEAPQAPQMSTADKLAARNKQYKTSEITNQRGITKDITVNEGTDKEYTLTLRYPGIAVASQIEDDASNANGSIRFSDLMQGAVDNDVFVQPHIKSLGFWDNHKGYGEVASALLSFLNDGIDGNLE